MPANRRGCIAVSLVLATLATARLCAQSLVPAGSINDAVVGRPVRLVADDTPEVMRAVTATRDRFFKGVDIAFGQLPTEGLAGHDVVAFVTPAHPFLAANSAALPFRIGNGTIEIDGRTFTGSRLRVIAAMKNPYDKTRKALVYAAENAADLVDVNAVFHGPTEWVVADGRRVLASGGFYHGVELAPEAMQHDLQDLLSTIADVHPITVDGLPAAVTAAADRAKAACKQPQQRAEFARLAATVLASLEDAHSAAALPMSGRTLALPLVWLQEGLVVAEASGDLQTGDVVVRIADRTPAQLEAALVAVLPAENEHWRRLRAANLLPDLQILAQLGVVAATPMPVTVRRGDGERTVLVGEGPVPQLPAPKNWVRYEILAEHSLGVFTFDRCVVDDNYRRTLAAFFEAVHEQKVRRIAVDLRRNSGGNSQVTDEFLRYLDHDDFADFSGDVRWSTAALQQREGKGKPRFEPARAHRRTIERVGTPPPFDGELFVLVGPATFSSGNWFATVMQDNGFAKVLGEPTGNAPSSYGDVLNFTLPASGLAYTLSFKHWHRPDPARDPAPTLVPDVLLPRTPATLRAGSDPVLDWLRAK